MKSKSNKAVQMNRGEIVIFKWRGEPALQVRLEEETVWLTQEQMAMLFDKNRKTITEHIRNVFEEKELQKNSVCRNFRRTARDGKTYDVQHYNLDAIISVGYRVHSPRGVQFRIWASGVLKNYLVKGYALNEQRLQEARGELAGLKNTVSALENVVRGTLRLSEESAGLLKVIADYTNALNLLREYDNQTLRKPSVAPTAAARITYDEARAAINLLKGKYRESALFGNEKDASLESSLAVIYQTADGKDLYPSIEEKAANLLYFVVKNHSFTDGNKRIAAFLFVWFMDRNGILYAPDGTKTICDETLVALTLMIASSKPEEKEIMVNVAMNLLAGTKKQRAKN